MNFRKKWVSRGSVSELNAQPDFARIIDAV